MKSLILSRMKSMRKCIGSKLAKAVLIKNMTVITGSPSGEMYTKYAYRNHFHTIAPLLPTETMKS